MCVAAPSCPVGVRAAGVQPDTVRGQPGGQPAADGRRQEHPAVRPHSRPRTLLQARGHQGIPAEAADSSHH